MTLPAAPVGRDVLRLHVPGADAVAERNQHPISGMLDGCWASTPGAARSAEPKWIAASRLVRELLAGAWQDRLAPDDVGVAHPGVSPQAVPSDRTLWWPRPVQVRWDDGSTISFLR